MLTGSFEGTHFSGSNSAETWARPHECNLLLPPPSEPQPSLLAVPVSLVLLRCDLLWLYSHLYTGPRGLCTDR